jgi:hypothetical protein
MYVLGDHNTRADARRFTIESIRLEAADRAGVYLESETRFRNDRLEERTRFFLGEPRVRRNGDGTVDVEVEVGWRIDLIPLLDALHRHFRECAQYCLSGTGGIAGLLCGCQTQGGNRWERKP